jgi:HAD superfamily hydrolase (TIGR01509 family)
VVERFVSARSDVRAHFFADAAPTLEAIRAQGLPVGALTNGNADVRRNSAVSAYFDFAVTAADAGAAKPHPVPFWQAAAAAGCRPCNLVHVGDDVTTDLIGALSAGCRAILVQRVDDAGDTPPSARGPVDATLPPVDDTRWRRVETLEQAVDVVNEWCAAGEASQR